jgi:uncharacterized protein
MMELLGRRLARTSGAPRAPALRRLRIGVIALSGLTVLGLLLAIWGFLIEPGLLLVRHVTIETAKWPAALPPPRIVAVADIHAGAPRVDEAQLDRIVAEVNAQNPDVVLLLGDYVIQHVLFGTPMPPDTIASHLGGLRAKHGVFAVLGNHDWYDGGKRVWRALENSASGCSKTARCRCRDPRTGSGSPTLPTTRRGIPIRREPFDPFPRGQLSWRSRTTPAVFPDVPARAALTVAGHTHGGQVSIPFWGALFIPGRSPLRYAYGHIAENGNDLYVTSGIGTTALPVRFNAPPEIVVITLRAPTP